MTCSWLKMHFLRKKFWFCLCLYVLLQLVIGYLHTSQLTGRLQLSDQTGSIDCVVGAWPLTTNESSATEHNCCRSDNCIGNISGGQARECPFIQTQLLGAVFRIDRFQLVVEVFQVQNGSTRVVCPYIQFAATDLLQLCDQSRQKLLSSLSLKSSSRQLPDSENTDNHHTQRTMPGSFGSRDISKLSPITQRVDCQNDSGEDMFASFVGSPSCQVPVIPEAVTPDQCRCSVSQMFVVDYCENIFSRSGLIEQLSMQFTATGCFIGPPIILGCGCPKSTGNSLPARLPLVRLVAILFSSRLVRWYPVLHSGCIYRLTYRSHDFSHFLGKFVLPRTSKTKLERHAARCLIVLDKSVEVERIACSSPSYRGLMLSFEEEAAISTAVDDVHSQLNNSDEFWQQHCHRDITR